MKKIYFVWLYFLVVSTSSFADSATNAASVLVRDVGVMGLASHDLFAWDHKKKINKENGRLDLSTIFGNTFDGHYIDSSDWFAQQNWKHLGNKKNSENAPVFTVATGLVNYFEQLIKNNVKPETARIQTLMKFHNMVQASFERLSGLPFPNAFGTSTESVTNKEQAAMRILHDILPGQVLLKSGKYLDVTKFKTAKTYLCEEEMDCTVKGFDGKYDPEYNNIRLPIIKWAGITMKLDLQKVDRRFIENAGLDADLASTQLKEVGEGKLPMSETFFAPYLIQLFTKAQSTINQDESKNTWLVQAQYARAHPTSLSN